MITNASGWVFVGLRPWLSADSSSCIGTHLVAILLAIDRLSSLRAFEICIVLLYVLTLQHELALHYPLLVVCPVLMMTLLGSHALGEMVREAKPFR